MHRHLAGSLRAARMFKLVLLTCAALTLVVGLAPAQATLAGHKKKAHAHHGKHKKAHAHHRKHKKKAHSRASRERDWTAPTAPQLNGAAGDQEVDLSWSASTDDVRVRGYRVYRNNGLIATVSASKRSFTDAPLTNGVTDTYFVKAYDRAGNLSPMSNQVTATPTAPTTPTTPTTPPPPTGSTTGTQPPPAPGTWSLAFSDEFNGTSLDLSKWRPNWLAGSDTTITKPVNSAELSCYDPAQVKEGGGVLTLSAIQSSCTASNGTTYAYRSGLIESSHDYQFTYGYMEARMWLPTNGSGTPVDWPAFWADGTGTWPTTGEIDVMEVLGGGSLCWHFHYSGGAPGGCPSIANPGGWHTFGADWEPGSITYYYDGAKVGQVTSGVTSAPMFLIANLGISTQHGGPLLVPAKVDLDYIRLWKH